MIKIVFLYVILSSTGWFSERNYPVARFENMEACLTAKIPYNTYKFKTICRPVRGVDMKYKNQSK